VKYFSNFQTFQHETHG